MTDDTKTNDGVNQTKSVELAQVKVWPDPQPLFPDDMKPSEFPIDSMLSMRACVEDIQSATQAPVGLVSASVLSVANFAGSASHNVVLHGGFLRPLSLMIITQGVSGERKSAVDALASQGIDRFQDAEMCRYRVACAKVDTEPDHEEPGPVPLVRVTNATLPGIEKAFEQGPSAIYLCSDEAGRILGGHSLKAENKTAAFAALSDYWDGKTVTRIYRGNDRNRADASYLKDCRLCMHLLGQPEVLKPLLTDQMARGQGILARAMLHSPPSNIGHRLSTVGDYLKPKTTGAANAFSSKIEEMLRRKPTRDSMTHSVARETITLNIEAAEIMVAYLNEVESKMADGERFSEARSFVNKSAEQAGRIAATLAVFEEAKEIEQTHMEAAVQIARYFAYETVRMLEVVYVDSVLQDAVSIASWISSEIQDKGRNPNHRTLTRGPQAARSSARRNPALRILKEYGWLKMQSGVYHLNPKLEEFA